MTCLQKKLNGNFIKYLVNNIYVCAAVWEICLISSGVLNDRWFQGWIKSKVYNRKVDTGQTAQLHNGCYRPHKGTSRCAQTSSMPFYPQVAKCTGVGNGILKKRYNR
jgi:hypothetical protein